VSKTRLDQWLFEHGYCESRTLAQRYIQAGQVFVNSQLVDKPATKIKDDDQIDVKALPRYVSRGGEKLEGALNTFSVSIKGKVCLDVGASTGGFTDCLLQHGATKVYSVDVGKHQLHPKLREDDRVIVLEELNARKLSKDHVLEPVQIVSADVSFISLSKVLPAVVPLMDDEAEAITLVKPQFEAGKDRVGRGGVVKNPEVHLDILQQMSKQTEALGLFVINATFSPIKGPAGNIEFLFHLSRHIATTKPNFATVVQEAHQTLSPPSQPKA